MAQMTDPLHSQRSPRDTRDLGLAWHRAGEVGPPVDLYETADGVIVRVAVPGAEGTSLSLTITEEALSLRGESPPPGIGWDRRSVVHWQEIPYGRFERTIPLPCPVDRDTTRASYKNGVLEVVLTKPSSRAGKTVQIQVR